MGVCLGLLLQGERASLIAASQALPAIVQAQDVLGLGSEARMNVPARASGNWRWRLEPGALNKRLAVRLREVTEEAGRLPAHSDVN